MEKETVEQSAVSLEVTVMPCVSFATHSNYVPLVRRVLAKNVSGRDLSSLTLRIDAEPEFSSSYVCALGDLQKDDFIEVTDISMPLRGSYLYSLTERLTGTLAFTVTSEDETVEKKEFPVELLTCGDWSLSRSMPEIVTAFVMPNHPVVASIIRGAAEYMKKWTGHASFAGYTTKNPNDIRLTMAAIYAAISSLDITYSLMPPNFTKSYQRLRLPDDIAKGRVANCLDMTLLYCACLEAASLNPIIIVTSGHTFCACWLEDSSFSESVIDDLTSITKRVAPGIDEILPVESTFMMGEESFDSAVSKARQELEEMTDFSYAVDVRRARSGGFRPMPLALEEDSGDDTDATYSDVQPPELISDDTDAESPEIIESETISPRQRLWERNLLDLSLRNTLLSFRSTKNTLQLMCSDLELIEDRLADGETLNILPRPTDWEDTERSEKLFVRNNPDAMNLADNELKHRRLRTYLDERELENSIKNIHRQAKLSIEENGANTLFLALGFLRWYESDSSEKARYAPIVLIPVEVVRKVQTREYLLRARDEEPRINVTLLELLRVDFGIEAEGLDPLPTDSSGVDVKLVLNIIRRAVMNRRRWDIEELAFLGLFSFGRFIMWNDIHTRGAELAKSPVVKGLVEGQMILQQEEEEEGVSLDELIYPSSMAVPLSADASQLRAIYSAAAGKSFVLHGPPGTGKSQTITNMIANALYQGKSVLFVAEKMAALTVVQNRLANIGLDPFCLELHSNKARKKEVLSQLERTLEVGRIKSPDEYESTAERINETRKELNVFVSELHKLQSYGMSLYDAITLYETNIDFDNMITLREDFPESADFSSLSNLRAVVSRLRVSALRCSDVKNHPLRLLGIRDYSFGMSDKLSRDIVLFRQSLEALSSSEERATKLFSLQSGENLPALRSLSILCRAFLNCSAIPEGILLERDREGLEERTNSAIFLIDEKNSLEESLLTDFSRDVFSYDILSAVRRRREAEQSWFLKKALDKSKLRKELRSYSKGTAEIDDDNIESFYDLLSRRLELANAVESERETMSYLFGLHWNGDKTETDAIRKIYSSVSFLREAAENCAGEQRDKCLRACLKIVGREDIEEYLVLLNNVLDRAEEMRSRYAFDMDATEDFDFWIREMTETTELWLGSLGELSPYADYLRSRDNAIKHGIGEVIDALEAGRVTAEDLPPAFDCAFAKACVSGSISESEALRSFRGSQFSETIKWFGELLTEFEELTIYELVSRLSARVPSSNTIGAASSEIGILRRAIKSGGRMMSIRRLFESIPSLLRRLCPCMLMSPISVAQYIDPAFPKFDLIIFDEASQLPTSGAVGAIARGEDAIIVGDPKQLPPTTFFMSTHIDDEVDMQDLESLLDDCLALPLPSEHLRWHYRSRHESLIAFSNMHYYDNRLYTFPSPNDMVSMVKHVHVDGVYDRGGEKVNRAEAEAVVSEIVRRYKDESLRNDSIGVVTFNSQQQNLIDDLLMEVFRAEPELEEINNRHSEPIFIKNLENVQGDERDVILFSVGYGPDKRGKITLNFGPLNREGGWRRLNVAISRARKEMVVYSTINPEDIDLSKTSSAGAAGLRGFLEFARRGKYTSLVRGSRGDERRGLEKIIAEELAARGYKVRCGVGCSEYKVDIGIVNDECENEYILGVICDGAVYRSGETARDRNVLQPGVLESLGWNIHRVWTLDYLENPDRELDAIELAVSQAKESRNEDNLPENTQNGKNELKFEKRDDTRSRFRKVYVCAARERSFLRNRKTEPVEFYLAEADVRRYVDYVVRVEAPISRDLLMKRVASAWGIMWVGPRVEEIIDRMILRLKLPSTKSGDVKFIWAKDMNPEEYDEYRVFSGEEDKRLMADICVQEVSNAVRDILANQIGMSKEDLARETAKVFGFQRAGSQIEQLACAGIAAAADRGFAFISDDGRVSYCD